MLKTEYINILLTKYFKTIKYKSNIELIIYVCTA